MYELCASAVISPLKQHLATRASLEKCVTRKSIFMYMQYFYFLTSLVISYVDCVSTGVTLAPKNVYCFGSILPN